MQLLAIAAQHALPAQTDESARMDGRRARRPRHADADACAGDDEDRVRLEYYDVKVGQGDGPAKIDQTVTIDYIAWLNDFEGKEFSRFEKPIKVKLGEKKVAPGLEECLLADMNIGGTRRCKLPAKLAYGSTGYPKSGEKAGSIIPPNADVYFQVRLRSVVLSKRRASGSTHLTPISPCIARAFFAFFRARSSGVSSRASLPPAQHPRHPSGAARPDFPAGSGDRDANQSGTSLRLPRSTDASLATCGGRVKPRTEPESCAAVPHPWAASLDRPPRPKNLRRLYYT